MLPAAAYGFAALHVQATATALAAGIERRPAEIETSVQGRLGEHILDSATGAGYATARTSASCC